jgi:TRAP-type C4-dicarboxylate transport system permease small subunit
VKLLEFAFERLERALIWIAIIATAIVMFMTSADALMRYVFNAPIVFAFEITEKYLMPASIFLAMSYAYRGGAFIRVTFLVDRLSGSVRMVANFLVWIISFACCAMFLYASSKQALSALGDPTTMATVNLRAGPAYALVPAGFLLLCIALLLDLRKTASGEAALVVQDEPQA